VQLFGASTKLTLAIIAITARCLACTIAYAGVEVGPNFRVSVEGQGRPVQGLRVVIQGSSDKVAADTDSNGFALFRGVKPGTYYLSAEHDAGIPDAELIVKPDGPGGITVPLRWPGISVRSLKGTIRGPDYVPGESQPKLSFDVLEGNSGRVLKSIETTDNGEFSFEAPVPGLYFLSLKPFELRSWLGETVTGLIAISVDREAPADHLDVDLGWSSCGLSYADRSKCPQRDLQVEQLSGEVLDPSGAVFANAKIFLLDTAGTSVQQLVSDREGRFNSPNSLTGTYELIVTSVGFTPFRGTVGIAPNGNSTRLSRLSIQLGIMGGCSAADTQ
jgi:Carboxypeptidase regulatory-like domain